MARFDLPLPELEAYRPEVARPADFDEFWRATIAEARALGWEPRVESVASALRSVDVSDVTFSGFGGQAVRAWLVTPAGAEGPLPTVVEFVGYGGGRGLPHERLAWANAGYAYLLMDTRGQGSVWSSGDTPDPDGTGPSVPGFLTRGIESPATYYYRRVYTDAVRLVDAARTLPVVDADRIALTGGSQGGGIAIAAAGLVDGLVAVMPDVPFLQDFGRAIGLTDEYPYREVVTYLAVHREAAAETYRTLSYFDGVNFAARATAPALFSVALHDQTCPPSTVYATRNRWAADAEIDVYPFNEHEGGGAARWPRQAAWLSGVLGR